MDGKSQKTEKDFQNQLEYISFKNILPHLRQVNVLEKEKVLLLFFWLWHSQICETASGAKPTFFFLKTIQPKKSGFDELPRFYDFFRPYTNLEEFNPLFYVRTKNVIKD